MANSDAEFIDGLINEVHNCPWLWQKNHKSFMCRTMKDNSWEAIGQKLGQAEKACRSKWSYLRDQYRKLKVKQPSGSARKPPNDWPWFASMGFLDEVPSTRQTSGNFPTGDDIENSGQGSEDEGTQFNSGTGAIQGSDSETGEFPLAFVEPNFAIDMDRFTNSTSPRQDVDQYEEISAIQMTPAVKPKQTSKIVGQTGRGRVRRNAGEDVDRCLVKYLEAKMAKPEDKEDDIYAQLIAARLKKLGPKHKRRVKSGINKLLDEAEEALEEESGPPVPKRDWRNAYEFSTRSPTLSSSSSSAASTQGLGPPGVFFPAPSNSPLSLQGVGNDQSDLSTLQPMSNFGNSQSNIDNSISLAVEQAMNY